MKVYCIVCGWEMDKHGKEYDCVHCGNVAFYNKPGDTELTFAFDDYEYEDIWEESFAEDPYSDD